MKNFLKLTLITLVACGCGGGSRKALAEDFNFQDISVAADNQGDTAVSDESVSLADVGQDDQAVSLDDADAPVIVAD